VPLVEVVELLIPCILHCENHVGKKIITIVLRRQIDHYRGPKEEFLKDLQNTLQREVLGTQQSPSHWTLKHSNDPTGQVHLKTIQARNQVIRKLMEKFDVIVESVVTQSDGEFRAKLISAITSYKEGISLLTMHRNLSAEEKSYFRKRLMSFMTFGSNSLGKKA
jgi:hypothetical protein